MWCHIELVRQLNSAAVRILWGEASKTQPTHRVDSFVHILSKPLDIPALGQLEPWWWTMRVGRTVRPHPSQRTMQGQIYFVHPFCSDDSGNSSSSTWMSWLLAGRQRFIALAGKQTWAKRCLKCQVASTQKNTFVKPCLPSGTDSACNFSHG